jgi:D-alanyl-D-alanine carboxypeptidase/D-alanyl-D-alanine carboxypeptidase (penicillin-binding protein 5/6)
MQDNGLHDAHELYSKNKLYKNREYAYEYLVGSKTGFTSVARQTLVTCAEKDGTRLICVIMKEETPYQFEDTIALFNYGFNNFYRVNIASNETGYDISHQDFFSGESTVF